MTKMLDIASRKIVFPSVTSARIIPIINRHKLYSCIFTGMNFKTAIA